MPQLTQYYLHFSDDKTDIQGLSVIFPTVCYIYNRLISHLAESYFNHTQDEETWIRGECRNRVYSLYGSEGKAQVRDQSGLS